jgi:hypothetical protein
MTCLAEDGRLRREGETNKRDEGEMTARSDDKRAVVNGKADKDKGDVERVGENDRKGERKKAKNDKRHGVWATSTKRDK